MTVSRSLVYAAVVLLIAGSLAVRALGIVAPYPTSADEARLIADLVQSAEHHRAGGSFFATYLDATRHSYLQRLLAHPLIPVFRSPDRAAFGLSAVAGLLSIVALTLTATALFSPEAAGACALLMMISLLHVNYSVKLLGVIHAYAAFSGALLCFADRRRSVWLIGGALLGVAFLLHSGAGLSILALGAAVVIADVGRLPVGVAMKKLVRDRAPVAAAAILVVLGYAVLQRRLAGFDYLTRLIHHENLSYPAPQSRFYWVRIFVVLDPVVVAILVFSLVTVAVRRRARDLPALFQRTLNDRFIDAGVLVAATVLTALGLTLSRTISGMARLLFVSAAMWYLVGGALVAYAWGLLPERARIAAFVTMVAIVLSSFGVAVHDWIATRSPREPVTAILNGHWRGLTVSTSLTYPDFLYGRAPFALLKRLSRTPDVVLGRPWYYDAPYYEEEPEKIRRLALLLAANGVTTVAPRDLVYTTLIYAVPPVTESACAELRRMLTVESNAVLACRRPTFTRFPPEVW